MELRPANGSATFTRTVTLDANGNFRLPGVPNGRFILHIKGTKWLAQNVSVDTIAGSSNTLALTLRSGDANNDNTADITDLSLLLAHYNQSSSASDYLEAADFDADGSNDIADLLLLVGSYNQLGDN